MKKQKQMEREIANSFACVKKDMQTLKETVLKTQEQIQHLSMNHALILERIEQSKPQSPKKKTTTKKTTKPKNDELEFYDIATKEKFKSSDYTLTTKSGRKFAVATSPTGNKSYRIIGTVKKKVVKKK